MAASGTQAEAALQSAIQENAGKFVLVVEGAIPARDDGVYMQLAFRPAIRVLKEVASQAAAVIAMGSCASWGGVPSADPNPTGAVGVDSVISGKPIINLPGCPSDPYNLIAVKRSPFFPPRSASGTTWRATSGSGGRTSAGPAISNLDISAKTRHEATKRLTAGSYGKTNHH